MTGAANPQTHDPGAALGPATIFIWTCSACGDPWEGDAACPCGRPGPPLRDIYVRDIIHTPETDLAWAAGFFDGEGCTFIARRKDLRLVRVAVSQKDLRPLERFQRAIGGHGRVYLDRISGVSQLVLDSDGVARAALRVLWPHLSEPKREQATRCLAESTYTGRFTPRSCTDPSHWWVRQSGKWRCQSCEQGRARRRSQERTRRRKHAQA
jgi:hypothetical protein